MAERPDPLTTILGEHVSGAPQKPKPTVKNAGAGVRSTKKPVGQYKLPGVPHRFTSLSRVTAFLKHSPGYVKKQRGWLHKNMRAQFNAAGYALDPKTHGITKYVSPADKAKAREAAAAAAAAKARVKARSGGGGAGAGGGADTSVGPTSDQSNNSGILDQIAGLNPNTGSMITRPLIDSMVNGQFGPGIADAQREIGKNPAQLKTNLADIKKWYGDVLASVDRAKTRGADMTKSITDANVGNAQAILGSIGGQAALGAQGVAQSAANASGTLAALGANDQSYLNDIQPLLQGEQANASSRETARMGDLLQGYKQQLQGLIQQKGGARAEATIGAIGQNNALDQTRFGNNLGLVQTAGALALDNAKAQNYLAEQQAKAQKSGSDQNKTILAQIGKAVEMQNMVGPEGDSPIYTQFPKGGLAPSGLVQQILGTFRANNVNLRDPRARQAAVGLIQSYGYKYDPKWVNGWN